MVKSIIYTLTTILLCLCFFIWTNNFIRTQLTDFNQATCTLYKKVEENSANSEDAHALRNAWLSKKQKLQIFIPHNDVAQIDYWLSEACALIYKNEYSLALAKLEILVEITKNLPDTYTVKLENVF